MRSHPLRSFFCAIEGGILVDKDMVAVVPQ